MKVFEPYLHVLSWCALAKLVGVAPSLNKESESMKPRSRARFSRKSVENYIAIASGFAPFSRSSLTNWSLPWQHNDHQVFLQCKVKNMRGFVHPEACTVQRCQAGGVEEGVRICSSLHKLLCYSTESRRFFSSNELKCRNLPNFLNCYYFQQLLFFSLSIPKKLYHIYCTVLGSEDILLANTSLTFDLLWVFMCWDICWSFRSFLPSWLKWKFFKSMKKKVDILSYAALGLKKLTLEGWESIEPSTSLFWSSFAIRLWEWKRMENK